MRMQFFRGDVGTMDGRGYHTGRLPRPGTTMHVYQRSFIEFALERGALRFGSFTLKSGRQSPYFFNTGVFDSGSALRRLGEYYAAALVESGLAFDMLYGPAYKGIPLGAAIAIALDGEHGRDVPFCFNRKEAKDHGEGGTTLGAPLRGRVMIVDDVISAGTSVNESMGVIAAAGATAGQAVTSDIIRVPSAEELKKGAKVEVIKPEDLEKEKAKQNKK